MTVVLVTRDELHTLRPPTSLTAVVMTMGALHRGHGRLIERARDLVGQGGWVIVTDFVNPRQFGAGEDFDQYPRTLDDDLSVATEAGADVLWAPSLDQVYRVSGTAARIAIDPGPLGDELEGRSRPGHFAGMLTVVAKLLMITRPDFALFGEKDFQQLVLIDAMVSALDLPVRVVPVETVRDSDGLALSSRNRYLSESARALAARIPAALEAGIRSAGDGAANVVAATRDVLDVPGIDIDYVDVRTTDLETSATAGHARLLVAVIIDGTRLIDNVAIDLGGAR